ncbi:hypothetical protein Cgig2_018598 [Carnegiea gigantea]|uniref:Uncharacterized protein n=1 Tax=Carnegiea gigantea TaxID=171969 RepID=A0A9Q1GIC2_9CARY|nr:hypothetical protein Cgig2_018598 [Carnegiea gigantea]
MIHKIPKPNTGTTRLNPEPGRTANNSYMPTSSTDVKLFLQHHNVGMIGLLETKVKYQKDLGSLETQFIHNYSHKDVRPVYSLCCHPAYHKAALPHYVYLQPQSRATETTFVGGVTSNLPLYTGSVCWKCPVQELSSPRLTKLYGVKSTESLLTAHGTRHLTMHLPNFFPLDSQITPQSSFNSQSRQGHPHNSNFAICGPRIRIFRASFQPTCQIQTALALIRLVRHYLAQMRHSLK